MNEKCLWRWDDFQGGYDWYTACGFHLRGYNSEIPHGFRFCPHCSKPIEKGTLLKDGPQEFREFQANR